MEWIAYEASLCVGCKQPRVESMNPANEERYKAEAIVCFACASRERKARNDAQNESGTLPGCYYAIVEDRE